MPYEVWVHASTGDDATFDTLEEAREYAKRIHPGFRKSIFESKFVEYIEPAENPQLNCFVEGPAHRNAFPANLPTGIFLWNVWSALETVSWHKRLRGVSYIWVKGA